MRRNGLFWGGLLILLGVLLLLQNMGVISVNVWNIFWPLVMIVIGAQLLFSLFRRPGNFHEDQLQIPLDGTNQAWIQFNHGAGDLRVEANTNPNDLVNGTFYGGIEHQVRQEGTTTRITLQPPVNSFWNFPWGFGYSHGFSWKVGINPNIPVGLEFKTGASENFLDLTNVKVTDLRIETGASSTSLNLPENAGLTHARIQSGAASLNIHIPASVAARIEVKSGLAGINIDTHRFIQSSNIYQSSDYLTSMNRVDLSIETGVGSVSIH